MDKKKKSRRITRTIFTCMLMVCMFWSGSYFDDPVYAASEFKYSSPFSNTGKSTYYHNGRFTGNLIVNGVDISDWQSRNCDFTKAKAAGVDFAIMRVTWTSYGKGNLTLHADEKFASQYKAAKAGNVMKGVYVFSQAKNASEGIKEANYAIARLKALRIGPEDLQLPVYMDYEFAGGVLGRMHGISRVNATNAAVAFCNTIKAAGYTPGIYANTTFFRSYIATSQLAPDVDLWCAQYYSRNESSVKYSKWQYSSSARINGMLSYTGLQGNIDVNFWYLNKKVNPKAIGVIKGRRTLSLADARSPKFKIYNGNTRLRAGVDYTIGGIRNNRKGKAYIYVKGIGKYAGYALIPIRVGDKTKGSANKDISDVCANYLKKASKKKSKYLTTTPSVTYKVGNTYTIQEGLNIRKGPGTNYARVIRSNLSSSMQSKTYSGTYAVLKPGVKVKCLKLSGSWMKIDGGWICCKYDDEIYVR